MTRSLEADHSRTYHRASVARCPDCGQTWARGQWGQHPVAIATSEPYSMMFAGSDGWWHCCTHRWRFRWEVPAS